MEHEKKEGGEKVALKGKQQTIGLDNQAVDLVAVKTCISVRQMAPRHFNFNFVLQNFTRKLRKGKLYLADILKFVTFK